MPRALWLLIIATTINITGASFLWPLNAIIMTQELGRTLTASGFVLMLNAGAGVIGSLLGGRLFDKLGSYKTIVLGASISTGSAMLLANFYEFFPAYTLFLMGMGLGSGMMAPAMYALAGSVWPSGGRKAFNAIYVAQNVGVSIGTALIGVVTAVKLTDVFIANALMHLGLLLFVSIAFRRMRGEAGRTTTLETFTERIPFKRHYRFIPCYCLVSSFFYMLDGVHAMASKCFGLQSVARRFFKAV